MDQMELGKLLADARMMGQIECRWIGIGETNNGMTKQKKKDQMEWGEFLAEARLMGRVEYRRIGMGETKNGM